MYALVATLLGVGPSLTPSDPWPATLTVVSLVFVHANVRGVVVLNFAARHRSPRAETARHSPSSHDRRACTSSTQALSLAPRQAQGH